MENTAHATLNNYLLPGGESELRGGRPAIVDIAWRVDVVLSSDELRSPRHNAQPMTVVNVMLSDGRVLAWRLRAEELHQWRYILSKAVKDLTYLERKRPVLSKASAKK